jgi:hypothetical protein
LVSQKYKEETRDNNETYNQQEKRNLMDSFDATNQCVMMLLGCLTRMTTTSV